MKKSTTINIVIAIVAFITLACGIDINGIPININADQPTPTQTVEPGPPEQTQDQPAVAGNMYLPAGVLVDPGNQTSLLVYSPSAQVLQEIYAPKKYGHSQGDALLAGAFSAQASTPLLYIDWYGEITAVMVSQNGSQYPLHQSNDIYRIKGSDGEDALVIVETVYNDRGLGNALYIGSSTSLAGADSPTYFEVSTDYFAFEPFSVRADSSNPLGVFYTMAAYGIGGDIVFAPRAGFYYYEVTSNSVYQILDNYRNPVGFSPDQSCVAHTDLNNQDLKVTVLDTGQSFSLPVLPSSDRGAGNLVFSPDSSRVVWMEGSGWQMADVPDFTSRLRMASYDGMLMWDIPATSFSPVVGSNALRVEPVAFLDNEHVLVQVRTSDWENPWLVLVNTADGSLSSFTYGTFVNLVYP